MNTCLSCGRDNDASSVFCRFCGTKFGSIPQVQQQNASFEYGAPRPYSWKTDEYQARSGRAHAASFKSASSSPPAALGHAVASSPMSMGDPRIRCSTCSSQVMPRIERKISTAGWITFALLLVFFFPLFWIGFLIKENVSYCPVCESKLG